jgi:UDP-N-acetylmuramyl pentapeptide phosphotransferase/UDP-N-acetylglucosamine-1-phosphate transferase
VRVCGLLPRQEFPGLGAYDDRHGADARSKLSVQFLVALLMWTSGYRVDSISTPFGILELGLLGLPFTVL